MSRPFSRRARRSSGSERLFSDAAGRLWSAAASGAVQEAIIFSCLSDAREPTRAIASPARFRLLESSDDELRRLLGEAPEVGRLT
jgi:hypothetical protein